MPNVLKNIVAFTGLAPGVATALPHRLQDADGAGIVPDNVRSDNDSVVFVSADDTNVTVINNGASAASANFLVERWHTEDRAFLAGAANLSPQPFVGAAVGGRFKLVERQVLGADAATMTFSGLNGDEDIMYKMVAMFDQSATFENVRFLPNGVLTDQTQHTVGFASSGNATFNDTVLHLLRGPIAGVVCIATAYFYARRSAAAFRPFDVKTGGNTGAARFIAIGAGGWENSADLLTSIVLDGDLGDIGAGADVSLFKLVA